MFKRRTVIIVSAIGLVVIAISIVINFSIPQPKSKNVPAKNSSSSNSDIKVSTYKDKNELWGYDVYVNGVLLVHQTNIPAVSGNRGFATEAEARKTAELMANKIRKNILPPSITIQELKDIGVILGR
mgnify:FL=1